MTDMAIDAFPEDDLPSPVIGRHSKVPASERAGQGVAPPRRRTPAAHDLRAPTPTVVPAIPSENTGAAPAPEAAPTEAAPTIEAPPEKKGTPRSARRSRVVPAARVEDERSFGGDLNLQLPQSLAEAIDADERSRPDVLRDAFGQFAAQVAEAHPPKTNPMLPDVVRAPGRRKADPEDPFVVRLFRIKSEEKAVFVEWQSKTCLSQSAFATELLRLEMGPIAK